MVGTDLLKRCSCLAQNGRTHKPTIGRSYLVAGNPDFGLTAHLPIGERELCRDVSNAGLSFSVFAKEVPPTGHILSWRFLGCKDCLSMEVRHARPMPGDAASLVGVRFVQLAHAERTALARALAAWHHSAVPQPHCCVRSVRPRPDLCLASAGSSPENAALQSTLDGGIRRTRQPSVAPYLRWKHNNHHLGGWESRCSPRPRNEDPTGQPGFRSTIAPHSLQGRPPYRLGGNGGYQLIPLLKDENPDYSDSEKIVSEVQLSSAPNCRERASISGSRLCSDSCCLHRHSAPPCDSSQFSLP